MFSVACGIQLLTHCVPTCGLFCVYRFGQIYNHSIFAATMSYEPPSYDPPPYAPSPDESKALHPPEPSEQPQQPQQQPPAAPTAPYESAVTYYLPTGPQQQQKKRQQLVANTQTRTVIVRETEHVQSYLGHIYLSCFVTWCCAWPCGLIAFIFASKCKSSLSSPQPSPYACCCSNPVRNGTRVQIFALHKLLITMSIHMFEIGQPIRS